MPTPFFSSAYGLAPLLPPSSSTYDLASPPLLPHQTQSVSQNHALNMYAISMVCVGVENNFLEFCGKNIWDAVCFWISIKLPNKTSHTGGLPHPLFILVLLITLKN